MSVDYFRQQVGFLESAIAEEQERIRRLRSCRARLIGQESVMNQANSKFKEPVLAQSTRSGKQADQFDRLRDSSVVRAY